MGGNRTHRAIESYSMKISRGTVETTPSKDAITNHTLYSMKINKNVANHTAFCVFILLKRSFSFVYAVFQDESIIFAVQNMIVVSKIAP